MITLATLEKASAQEVFDQVVNHLKNQNKQSYSCGECLYRHGDLKCAAGCLISDTEYHKNMEGKSWDELVADGDVPKAHEELIIDLQKIHDDIWRHFLEIEKHIIDLARERGLSYERER